MSRELPRIKPAAGWLASAVVGLVLSPLLIGFEPVGGDPDRIFRPIKSELARAYRSGAVPFWSDRLGLGVPLVAESHAAAFYPPNVVLYRLLDVATAYRLSMWLHTVLIAWGTSAYGRMLGLSPWGAALAGVAFALCGFQAVHSSHEWAYHALAYVPLVLIAVEKYLATGRLLWMAVLALFSGLAWTLGHFQIQTWLHLIIAIVVLWRVAIDRRPFVRSAGVMVALLWGVMIAAAQLGPSWDFARNVGQADRDRMFYSFPPAHWVEPALPEIFRGIDAEDRYWFKQQSTGYEACFYVGTIPLIFAFVGLTSRDRGTQPWKLIIAVALALATMPRWWPQGYQWLLMTPGIGLFRCPARWTVFASLGLALVSGGGFDAGVSRGRFWVGVGAAVTFGTSAAAVMFFKTGAETIPRAFVWTALGKALAAWVVSLGVVLAWRRWPRLAPLVVAVAGAELGLLYYHMTTRWGWSVDLERDSPLFRRLLEEEDVGLVGGPVDNLPLRVGLATGEPYAGFKPLGANEALAEVSALEWLPPRPVRWPHLYERLGITHMVVPGDDSRWLAVDAASGSSESPVNGWRLVWIGEDPALARLSRWRGRSRWALLRSELPVAPEAEVRTQRGWLANRDEVRGFVFRHMSDSPNHVALTPPIPQARYEQSWMKARLDSWDGTSGQVTRDGWAALVLRRAYDPNWRYRIDGGPWERMGECDGGFAAAWFELSGWEEVEARRQVTNRVEVRYFVPGWPIVATSSAVSSLVALTVVAWCLARARTRGA